MSLSKNERIELSFFERDANKNLDWGYSGMSAREDITFEFYKKYKHKNWDKYYLKYSKEDDIEFIISTTELGWDYNKLYNKDILDLQFVENTLDTIKWSTDILDDLLIDFQD